MYLGTAIPRHKKRFDTLICALHTLISYVIMSRPLPNEEMTRKSIYGPARLLNIPHLSERVVEMFEKEYTGPKVIDPQQASVQSKIFEYIKEDPTIPYQYGRDDLRTERILKARLLADQIQSTESQISVAMVEWERMRS